MTDTKPPTLEAIIRYGSIGTGLLMILAIQLLILAELNAELAGDLVDGVKVTIYLLFVFTLWPTIRFVGNRSLEVVGWT